MAALTPGTRLGPYEVLAPLGAGGMGEVYKARDTRLDRTVAIKVLSSSLAADAAVRARFEREARAVSTLEHPNICALYDVGREGGVEYLVMQYLDGETLASRLSRGAIPLQDALRYAIEIAGALDKAHRAGILHRDLKPGNIMLARAAGRDTTAKLLDFGLAKVASVLPGGDAVATQATVTSALTGEGTILGTLLYMSPEQLEGRELDARSDIFSFGAVLYEMLTGKRAFEAPSQASIIASILERDPPSVAAHLPVTPAALDRVVRKCLAKDPERRWQSASDLCDELSWIAQSSGVQQPVPHVIRGRRLPVARIAVAALIVALAGALGWSLTTRVQPEEPAFPRTLSIALPDGVSLSPGGVAISPDGRTIVYGASGSAEGGEHRATMAFSGSRLYLRNFSSSDTTVVAGSEGGRTPFFSPDGLTLGFFRTHELVKVALQGGPPVVIGSVPPVTRGGVWLPDDRIVVTPTQVNGLFQIQSTGGDPRPVTELDTASGEKAHMWPSLLPGGKEILYTIRRGTASNETDADIAVVNLASGEKRVVVRGGAYPRYSSTGHLLFVRGGTLMGVPFDLAKTEASGTPIRIAQELATHAWIGGGHYDVAADGTLVFMRGSFARTRSRSAWVDRSGKQLSAPALTETNLGKPRLSPDGSRVVFDGDSRDGDSEVFVGDVTRGTSVRLSADPADDFNPIWTHDGRKIIWTSLPASRLPFLVWRPADGSAPTEELVKADGPQFVGSVSPQGVLAYTQVVAERGTTNNTGDIWVVPLTGERKARPLVTGPAAEYGPEFSPDGKWIAYTSTEGGAPDIYAVPYPGPGGKRRVTTDGGVAPAWSRNGRELFYQTSQGLWALPIVPSTDLQFGTPRLLFTGDYARTSREDGPREYDVTEDGTRFLMLKTERVPGDRPPSLAVVLHWWKAQGNR